MESIRFCLKKSERITKLVHDLYDHLPEIEPYRAELVTESYKQTENLPIIKRRSAAFRHILENFPVVIRDGELIAGSNSVSPRGCQTFPEYSFEWLEPEFDTIATREADPFYISDDTKRRLSAVHPYWKGKTVSDLAASNMDPEVLDVFLHHGIFTVGNYFYNGIGHVNVNYEKVIRDGYASFLDEVRRTRASLDMGSGDYITRKQFLDAVEESLLAVIGYAHRYAELAEKTAGGCADPVRRRELKRIADACRWVPEHGARTFFEACQSFWFVQQLLQLESSGHSISPGRFDQYMYPYFRADIESGRETLESAQELIDNIWVKLNDLNKVRDAASAKGFAGYGLFQNLIVGGQDEDGRDATNELSYLCLEASMHVRLPQPSLSIRIWNGTPHDLMIKAVSVTRDGLGVPAFYNDEVIIPALMNRGLSLAEARDYCIIGCVEPQKGHMTDGWHDAAFFNMCRPLEMVFSDGFDRGVQIGPHTGNVEEFSTFEEFFDAYKKQEHAMLRMLVNADNAVDLAHAVRCPLPFESSMVDDCIGRGRSLQEGGAHYNFTGPQGFGIANVTDALTAIRELVYNQKSVTMKEMKEAIAANFGEAPSKEEAIRLTAEVVAQLTGNGVTVTDAQIADICRMILSGNALPGAKRARYHEIKEMIDVLPRYGNDDETVDLLAREVAYTYTRPLETFTNPRGGRYQAGLYPVSANVPLGAETGATPDGRLCGTPIADGVGPAQGRDTHGPTAAANSVAKLDHGIASNGTLFNMKFHPSALAGMAGLEKFAAFIRGFFDQKGMHVQFNVVSRETLLDAQAHPENYKTLVVRVAGYSALFTTLSRSLQDDIISRTEQGF